MADSSVNGGQESLPPVKPGDTIAPGVSPAAAPIPAPNPVAAAAPLPSPEVAPMAAPAQAPIAAAPEESISWMASEFIAHNKPPFWYMALIGGAAVLAALVWLFTKDKISTGVVVVAAITFASYGARKPRQLQYQLTESGLMVGEKYHDYQEFRSFSVVPEGAFSSIVFMPLKRFAPLTTIYYDPADEAKIIDLLAERLPHEERQKDLIDRLMWRIRF